MYFGQKDHIEVKFSGFWVVGLNFSKFLMSYLKPQVNFSLNFEPLFIVMRDNFCELFSWNFIWFGQKKPIKMEIIGILAAHVKFYQYQFTLW